MIVDKAMGGVNLVVSSSSNVYAMLENVMTRFNGKSSPYRTNKIQSTISDPMSAFARNLTASYESRL